MTLGRTSRLTSAIVPVGAFFLIVQALLLASHANFVGDAGARRGVPEHHAFVLGGSARAMGPASSPMLRGGGAAAVASAAARGRGVPLPTLAAMSGGSTGDLLALARRALANSSSSASVPQWLRAVLAESQRGAALATERGWFARAKLGVLVTWGPATIAGWAPSPELDPECGERFNAADIAAVGLNAARSGGGGGDGALYAGLQSEMRATESWWRCNPLVEWYGNTMAVDGSPTRAHHARAFDGAPYAALARTFESHAGAWLRSPDGAASWARAFGTAGARYVVVNAKGPDGYALWPSDCSGAGGFAGDANARCSTASDIVGHAMHAVRERGMRFGVSASHGLDFNFNGGWAPGAFGALLSPPFARPDRLGGAAWDRRWGGGAAGAVHTEEEEEEEVVVVDDDDAQEWHAKIDTAVAARRARGLASHCTYATRQLDELVKRFVPDLVWNDGGFPRCGNGQGWRARLAAHRAVRPSCVTNDRWAQRSRHSDGNFNSRFTLGQNVQTATLLQQRWRPPGSATRPWELRVPIQRSGSLALNARRVAGKYRATSELIHLLADVASKNGNLLLAVSPFANGTIPTPQLLRMQRLGGWLAENGKAIFDTAPVGEDDDMCCATVSVGPGGQVPAGEVRFTRGGEDQVYAIVLMPTTPKVRAHKVRRFTLRPLRIDDLDATAHVLPRTQQCAVTWKNSWVNGAWQVDVAIHKSAQCRRSHDAHAFALEIMGGATMGKAAMVPPAVAAHEGDDDFAAWERT